MTEAFAVEVAGADVDSAHLLDLGAVRFERHRGDLYAIVDADHATALAAFARSGLRARPATLPSRAATLVPARLGGLDPLAAVDAVDIVSMRALHVGEASARVAPGRWARRRRRDHARLRAILRGDDRMIAWRRIAWLPRSVLRRGVVRGARPIVFDQASIDAAEERCDLVATSALSRWLAA